MKSTIRPFRSSRLIVLLVCLMTVVSCQKEISHQEPQGNWQNLGTGEHQFSIQSDNITKTADGMKFNGTIRVKNNQGQEFEIGRGQFDVKTGAGDAITSFKGKGIAEFPKVGLFAEMLKHFTWKFIESHIEYETGKYYKETYNTDIPLDDDRRYLHFQAFDEQKDGQYQLRSIANSIIYKFLDAYLDPSDPALFIKTQFPTPDDGAEDFLSKFWGKVGDKLGTTASKLGKYADMPNLIFGISSQGTFKSRPYKFTVFDGEKFKEEFGFNQFESLQSHLFLRVAGIPIPGTVVLQVSGELFVHYPVSSLTKPGTIVPNIKNSFQDVIDFLTLKSDHGYMLNLNGSLDPGAKGVGLILGMLPEANKIFGKEIFNKDFNIDLAGGTLQLQIGKSPIPSFLRFGFETKVPVFSQLLGDDYRKYLSEVPTVNPSFFQYFSIGPNMDDITGYFEQSVRMRIPFYGDYDLIKARLISKKTGISVSAKQTLPLGPIILSGELNGSLSPQKFSLTGIATGNLELPGGVKLISNTLNVKLSSDSGVTLNGKTELPYGLGKAEVKGQLTTAGLTLSGKLNAGVSIDLGNGYKLPTANMEFSLSTNPAEGFRLKGNVTVPRVGMVAVEGKINSDDFFLSGKVVANQISFGSVSLPYGSGSITISKKNGVVFKGQFNLGSSFGQVEMQGKINATTIDITGSLRSTLTIAGHNFNLANGKIVANNAGVKLNGNLNLYIFSVAINGSMLGVNNFALTGTFNYNSALVKATIKVDVKPTAVSMSGTGRIYGPLGNQLFSGTLSFYPDWNAKTIRVCYRNSSNIQLCLNL